METLVQSNEAPDIITFLRDEYLRAMYEHEDFSVDRAELADGAKQFCEFAIAYLTEHRPRGSYPSDDNVGLTLSNGRRLLISPGVEVIHGTMAPIAGKTVDDTPGRLGSVGYMDQGAVPISGFPRKPKGSIDYNDNSYGMNKPKKGEKLYLDKTATGENKIFDPETARKLKKAVTVDDPLNR